MASNKISIANQVRTGIIANVADVTNENCKLVLGGTLSQEQLNEDGYTFVVSPLERVRNVTVDRCASNWLYQVGVAIFKKLDTRDTAYRINAASESEIDQVDSIAEEIEDYLVNTSFGGFYFSDFESDMQLDPTAFDHGYFRHTMMVTFVL